MALTKVGKEGITGISNASDGTAITIGSDENVGIGLASTSGCRLEVKTTSSDHLVARFENSHASGSYGISVKAGDDSGNYPADFANKSGTSLMRVRGDGNVGIGTTSPGSQLHLSTSTAQNDAHGQLKVVQTDTSGGASTNAGINLMNHYGTSQFMQWEDNGLRIGSRILTNSGVGDVVFTAGADAEKMRILAGGGITFNGDTAAANALDDYEEGTWSPQIYLQNAGNQSNASNQTQDGRYTKIGNIVTLQFSLIFTLPSSLSNDNIGVKNFPFTPSATIKAVGGVMQSTSLTSGAGYLLFVEPSETRALLLTGAGGGNLADEVGSGSGKQLYGSIVYQTG